MELSFQKNMAKPLQHYKAAYELLETQNGSPADKDALKNEIVTSSNETVE